MPHDPTTSPATPTSCSNILQPPQQLPSFTTEPTSLQLPKTVTISFSSHQQPPKHRPTAAAHRASRDQRHPRHPETFQHLVNASTLLLLSTTHCCQSAASQLYYQWATAQVTSLHRILESNIHLFSTSSSTPSSTTSHCSFPPMQPQFPQQLLMLEG